MRNTRNTRKHVTIYDLEAESKTKQDEKRRNHRLDGEKRRERVQSRSLGVPWLSLLPGSTAGMTMVEGRESVWRERHIKVSYLLQFSRLSSSTDPLNIVPEYSLPDSTMCDKWTPPSEGTPCWVEIFATDLVRGTYIYLPSPFPQGPFLPNACHESSGMETCCQCLL